MDFDKTKKVKLDTLNKLEAEIYIEFLEDEKGRHIRERERAKARVKFWQSAAERHAKDVASAYLLIDKVKQKFNIS